jgi:hypothetical protein
VIDIVRAARGFPVAHASAQYIVWGWSQGAHAAMFTARLAASYAPELYLQGVVPVAGPSNYPIPAPTNGSNLFYLALSALGAEAAYGKNVVSAKAAFTKSGWRKAARLKKTCSFNLPLTSLDFAPGAFARGSWPTVTAANDPGRFTARTPSPMLLVNGGVDTVISSTSSTQLMAHFCDLGQNLERWVYPSLGHGVGSGSAAATGDVIEWIAHRFAGDPAPGAYVPVGALDVQTEVCP